MLSKKFTFIISFSWGPDKVAGVKILTQLYIAPLSDNDQSFAKVLINPFISFTLAWNSNASLSEIFKLPFP